MADAGWKQKWQWTLTENTIGYSYIISIFDDVLQTNPNMPFFVSCDVKESVLRIIMYLAYSSAIKFQAYNRVTLKYKSRNRHDMGPDDLLHWKLTNLFPLWFRSKSKPSETRSLSVFHRVQRHTCLHPQQPLICGLTTVYEL